MPKKIHEARDLLKLNVKELWAIPDTKMKVKFDDGIVNTHARRIILSHYTWWPQREWEGVPLLKEHCLKGRFKKSSVLNLLNKTTWIAVDHVDNMDVEYLGVLVRKAITTIYNTFTYRLEPWVTGLDATDLLAVADNPRVKAVNDELLQLDLTKPGVLMNSEKYIAAAHKEIGDVMKNDTSLKGTRQYELAASEQVNIGSQLQLSGPRGHVSDIDSNIFHYPIMPGYGQGLKKLIQFSMDSRAAAKALIFTQHPLQETEYTNRQLQILASTLVNLHVDDDCNSTELIPWRISKHNVGLCAGMWYSESAVDIKLKEIVPDQLGNMFGKTIYLRTAMTCRHEDQYGICGKCFGELRRQIPRYTNIGHASVTELCSKVSQDVLSVKHLDGTAVTGAVNIMSPDLPFLKPYHNKQQIGINPTLLVNNIKLRIPKEGMENLADIFNVSKVEKLAESKITAMSEVCLEIEDGDGDLEFHHVIVGDGGKKSYFTSDFLKFVKSKSYGVVDDKLIVIDLDGWDLNEPMWQIPKRHASALEFLRDVKSDIKNTNKGRRSAISMNNEQLGVKLLTLSDLVSTRFKIHITHLATVIRTTMTTDSKNYNYHIPNKPGEVELETYRKLLLNRSLGGYSGYQELGKMFHTPHSYIHKDRPYSSFDEFLNVE